MRSLATILCFVLMVGLFIFSAAYKTYSDQDRVDYTYIKFDAKLAYTLFRHDFKELRRLLQYRIYSEAHDRYGASPIARMADLGEDYRNEIYAFAAPYELLWWPISTHFIVTGDLENMRMLLDHGINLDWVRRGGKTVLGDAMMTGNVDMVELILQYEISVAPDYNQFKRKHYLIDAVRYRTKGSPDTPEQEAVDAEVAYQMARMLILRGADIFERDIFQQTPLFYAEGLGREKIAAMLRKYGAIYVGSETPYKDSQDRYLLDDAELDRRVP